MVPPHAGVVWPPWQITFVQVFVDKRYPTVPFFAEYAGDRLMSAERFLNTAWMALPLPAPL
jgi:hypothetical protein